MKDILLKRRFFFEKMKFKKTTNIFLNSEIHLTIETKCNLLFGQIQFAIWTHTTVNLQYGEIHLAIWTN